MQTHAKTRFLDAIGDASKDVPFPNLTFWRSAASCSAIFLSRPIKRSASSLGRKLHIGWGIFPSRGISSRASHVFPHTCSVLSSSSTLHLASPDMPKHLTVAEGISLIAECFMRASWYLLGLYHRALQWQGICWDFVSTCLWNLIAARYISGPRLSTVLVILIILSQPDMEAHAYRSDHS